MGARVGQAAFRMVGQAEVGLHPMVDGFDGGAVEGLGDALRGPGADQRAQAQQQGAEAALLLVAFQKLQATEAGLQHLGQQRQTFALGELCGLSGHELQQVEPQGLGGGVFGFRELRG